MTLLYCHTGIIFIKTVISIHLAEVKYIIGVRLDFSRFGFVIPKFNFKRFFFLLFLLVKGKQKDFNSIHTEDEENLRTFESVQ